MIEPLFEDRQLLVALKPPNLLSQGDATGDPDLLGLLKEMIRVRDHKPGNVYLGLVHRLDRPVGGLMVFAKTSKAAARLSAQLREHAIGREYLCVVTGEVPDRLDLTDYLLKDEQTRMVRVVPPDRKGAQKAVLHAVCVARRGDTSLLAVTLETGRSHQIRVQLAHAGAPLWGDQRYGKSDGLRQIALWGYRLTVEHPISHERMQWISLPEGGIWSAYAQDMAAFAKKQEENP